jgi:hypothetical protein
MSKIEQVNIFVYRLALDRKSDIATCTKNESRESNEVERPDKK